MIEKIERSEAEWSRLLSPEAFRVLRQRGTEPPFSGEHSRGKVAGTFRCTGCGLELFDATAKYDSGTGWPSFYQPAHPDHIVEKNDLSHGMIRTEVLCARCGGHLGHRFPDGPRPTGQRYCINSVALKLDPTAPG